MQEAKLTIRDSVFSDLFRDKRYLLKLYQALHPEDTETTEDDLVDVTIQNVLTNDLYNDLGFRNNQPGASTLLYGRSCTWRRPGTNTLKQPIRTVMAAGS